MEAEDTEIKSHMPLHKIKHNTGLVFVYCVISMKRACFSFKKD